MYWSMKEPEGVWASGLGVEVERGGRAVGGVVGCTFFPTMGGSDVFLSFILHVYVHILLSYLFMRVLYLPMVFLCVVMAQKKELQKSLSCLVHWLVHGLGIIGGK